MNMLKMYKMPIWKKNEKGPYKWSQLKNPGINDGNRNLDLKVKASNWNLIYNGRGSKNLGMIDQVGGELERMQHL